MEHSADSATRGTDAVRSPLRRLANGWPLFWLLSALVSAAIALELFRVDTLRPEDISHMISYSVRWGAPFIFLVVATSALHTLAPGAFSRWCLRNRRYLGLVFAVAMAWQGVFIFFISTRFAEYYYADIYLLRDELEGSCGYLLLAAMVLTSFDLGRRRLSSSQWKFLHRSGMYFLWAYPFSVYWWNLFYYPEPRIIDYLFYAAGFAAMAARTAAWAKRRGKRPGVRSAPAYRRACGTTLLALGLLAAASGQHWQPILSPLLLAPNWSAGLGLWLPFWPFEPFLPLLLLVVGTWLAPFTPTRLRDQSPDGAQGVRTRSTAGRDRSGQAA